jgi:predicted aspartyl protease
MVIKILAASALAVVLSACGTATPPAPAPAAYTPPPPPPVTITLGRTSNGGLLVPAIVNGVPLQLIIDSGADSVVLPVAVAKPMMDLGLLTDAEFIGKGTSVLANGNTVENLSFRLQSVTLGSITLHGVDCVIVPGDGPALLGQAVLSALPAWKIDNSSNSLEIS